MPLQQQTRRLKLTTPLGDNVLLLVAFRGREELSRLSHFQLDMISDTTDIEPARIVGLNVTVSMELADGSERFFNGFVSQFVAGDEGDGRRNYRAEVVPWLWFLTQTADCRIFQNKKVDAILQQIFGDLGFSDYEFNLGRSHKTWEYCVQYRETDFNFVSRLMEQEGLFYFFKHEDGKHTLVICDHAGAYVDCPESEIEYPGSIGTAAIKDHLTSWEHRYNFCPGKWAQTDYNFQTPSTSLMSRTNSLVSLPGNSKYEVYDFPGAYADRDVGDSETTVRMELEEVAHNVVHATSQCRTLMCGGKFSVSNHPSESEAGKSYLITSIQHQAVEALAYETGGPEGQEYGNQFTCIPSSVTFRPDRSTRKPTVSGVQTAMVVGPGGEEIYTDAYGRVKVQFHWDREGKRDENSSCWVRVSQNWAGKNWGAVFHPRIGQEVIVDFLEGDPDRPIIVGRVYNAEQMPPYELPAEQTKSTIKSRSSKGGGTDNFNEIRFEDKLGSEEMYIHAEKDQNTVVEHDQTIAVGNDRSETIGRDRSLQVDRDKSETVDRNKSIRVKGAHDEQVDGTMTVMIGASLTETVAVNYAETVGAAMELSVGGALAISVGAIMATSVGASSTETVGGSKSVTVGSGFTLDVGKTWTVNVGENQIVQIAKDAKEKVGANRHVIVKKDLMMKAKRVQVTADDEITFKTGSAEVTMKKNGDITISGKKINVKGSSDVIIKGSQIKEN
jgi:type VI secretion system secreted protein VgrG